MPRHVLAVAVLLAAAIHPAGAAEPIDTDQLMLQFCDDQLTTLLFGDTAQGLTTIVDQNIQHEIARNTVHLDLAGPQGKVKSGSCTFRDGKLVETKPDDE